MTGRTPELLQDCDRKLSRALSKTPEAHARPDHCDVCDAPQMVLPDGAHACGPVAVSASHAPQTCRNYGSPGGPCPSHPFCGCFPSGGKV